VKAGLRPDGPLSLRPQALAALLYIGAGVRVISRSQQPLEVTAAATDAADLATQARLDRGLADADPLHATGYAFDIARSYATRAQAQAFQFVLDRLLALNIIAWVRHTHIIHVAVGPGASTLASVLPKH
jgi:hypothetical protein